MNENTRPATLVEHIVMRVLVSTARNIRHIWNDDEQRLASEIEAVLTVYGRHTDFVGAGLSSVEKCETIRFTMTPESARKLAERCTEWADEAERQSDRIEVKSA